MRFRLGEQRIAIEHTLVEPFVHAIRSGKEFEELVEEIVAALNGAMPPPGIYYLTFPLHPTAGRHRRTHAALRQAIIDWVQEAAQELFEECPEREDRNRRPHGYNERCTTEIDGMKLVLERRVDWNNRGDRDGSLFVRRDAEDDIASRRDKRLEISLDKKLPKLAACRAEGDVTILVLEFSDIALTSHVHLAKAIERAIVGRDDVPDHVFIVDTTCEGRWALFQPITNGIFSIDMEWHDL